MIFSLASHITPIVVSLHWLPVKYRIEFKILQIVYTSLNDFGPKYKSIVFNVYKPSRSLRSARSGYLAVHICIFLFFKCIFIIILPNNPLPCRRQCLVIAFVVATINIFNKYLLHLGILEPATHCGHIVSNPSYFVKSTALDSRLLLTNSVAVPSPLF